MKPIKLPFNRPKSNAITMKKPENRLLVPSSLSELKANPPEVMWPFVAESYKSII